MQETELVTRLNTGEEAAFVELFDTYGPAMFKTACSLSKSAPDAEDAVQDVFVAIARMRGRMAGIQNLKTYLFASLRHALAKKACKADAEPVECIEDRRITPSPDNPPEASAALERALGRLQADQRQVVAYKVDAGMTFKEIGMALGISPNTAASRWRYALDKLRMDLEGLHDED